MTGSELLNLGLGVLAATAVWSFFVITRPAIRKAHFLSEVSAIKSKADRAVIEGALPPGPHVDHLTDFADSLLRMQGGVSLAPVAALYLTHRKHNGYYKTKTPTYENLPQSARRIMHQLDREMIGAVSEHVMSTQSRGLIRFMSRHLAGTTRRRRGTAPKTRQLAREIYLTADHGHIDVTVSTKATRRNAHA